MTELRDGITSLHGIHDKLLLHFQAVSCLCRWVRDKDHQLHGLLAGFLAGWSMLFYRSSSIAMYVAIKLSEVSIIIRILFGQQQNINMIHVSKNILMKKVIIIKLEKGN